MLTAKCAGPTARSRLSTTTYRMSLVLPRASRVSSDPVAYLTLSTVSRKNFTDLENFIAEPDSRAQCMTLEQNVKAFGLTYFGMTDRRQGE